MPPVIAPVIASAVASIGASAAAATAIGSIAAYALVTGAAFGLQIALAPGQQRPKVASQQYQIKQALPPLFAGYGIDKLGGAKFVFEAPGGFYIDGLVHCLGPIDGFITWYLADDDTGIPAGSLGGANSKPPTLAAATIESHLGDLPQQAASNLLLGKIPGWTAAHRLDGLAYSVLQLQPVAEKNFSKVYPQGAPQLSVVARLLRIWDPRDPTQTFDPVWHPSWKWSQNPACAILHYLTASRGVDTVSGRPIPIGFGLPLSRINVDSFKTFADVCEQAVPLKDGGVETRYRINGCFNLAEEERSAVLAKLLATCDAELYQDSGGRIAIRGGVWTEPTVTIGPEHILSYEHEDGSDAVAAFNRLKLTFKSGAHDHQVIDGDPLDDLANQALTGKVITSDFSVPMVSSHPQARRLAKIAKHKGNPRHKLTITTDLYGLLALGERTIRIVLPELGIDDAFLVSGFVQASDGATCVITAASLGPEAYAWDPAVEEGTPPALPQGFDTPVTVPDLDNLAVSIDRTEVGGTITGLALRVMVDAPDNPAFALRGRYRAQGAGDDAWQEMTSAADWAVASGPVDDGTTYEVQARLTGLSLDGPWSASQVITATADTTAPGSPGGLSGVGAAGQYSFAFTTPSSPNYGSARLFRGTTTDFGSATPVGATFYGAAGQAFDRVDAAAPGTYRLWVRAYNRSGFGDATSTAGPIEVTVT